MGICMGMGIQRKALSSFQPFMEDVHFAQSRIEDLFTRQPLEVSHSYPYYSTPHHDSHDDDESQNIFSNLPGIALAKDVHPPPSVVRESRDFIRLLLRWRKGNFLSSAKSNMKYVSL